MKREDNFLVSKREINIKSNKLELRFPCGLPLVGALDVPEYVPKRCEA
jgi:transcription elongation GreA/GreB family factor